MIGISRSLGASVLAVAMACAADPGFARTPGARCDLRSGSLAAATRCLDLDSLNGTTLRVPSATTRLSTDGLVFCNRQTNAAAGTDIVYIVDQSGSMIPGFFLVDGTDTLVYQGCMYSGNNRLVPFRGRLMLEDTDLVNRPTTKAYCDLANDPYGRRAAVVQDAIALQASLSQNSQAGWISFGEVYHVSPMYNLSNAASKAQLAQQIKLDDLGGTDYRDPLGWARVMLQGGHDSASPRIAKAPSPNPRKAIIMISDGDPNDVSTYLNALKPRATFLDTAGRTWIVDADSTPPVYGIYLSTISRKNTALQVLAQQTGGQYYLIPPSDPDSLKHVIARIVGSLFQSASPDSFRIANTSNGQISAGISSRPEGGGTRIRLDSIVGLVPGRNDLEIRSNATRISGQAIRWTVVVDDSGSMFSSQGMDSLVTATCSDPSHLSLRPGSDTTRAVADERDTTLVWRLDASNAGQGRLSTTTFSAISMDTVASVVPVASGSARVAGQGSIPWKLGTSIRNDFLLQTGTGRDTARIVYRTPRDFRDSATATLPVVHPRRLTLRMSPDTARGTTGSLDVFLTDSLRLEDTALAWITHRAGDSVRVVLRRIAGPLFRGTFGFAQLTTVVRGDSVVQTGSYRTLAFDSLFASRGNLRDTSLLRTVGLRIRYLLGNGSVVDTLSVDRDVLDRDTIRFQLWNPNGICTTCSGDAIVGVDSSAVSVLDTAGLAGGRVAYRNGMGNFVLRGIRPVQGAVATIDAPASNIQGTIRPVTFRPYRIVFVDTLGTRLVSPRIDQSTRTARTIGVQVWGSSGPCPACLTSLVAKASVPDLSLRRRTAGIVVAATAFFDIRSDRPLEDGTAIFSIDSLSATASVFPIRFAVAPPDSAQYLDLDADGSADHVRVFFATPWNPSNRFVFPWPNGTRDLSSLRTTARPSPDSLVVDLLLTESVSDGATGWSGPSVPATWRWSDSDPTSPFPARDRIPPVIVRAVLAVSAVEGGPDTLELGFSEPVVHPSGRDWIRWGRPSDDSLGEPVRHLGTPTWNGTTLRYLVDSTFHGGLGDSVRVAAWPDGGLADTAGNGPGRFAHWTPMEIRAAPGRIQAMPWPPMVRDLGWQVPPAQPQLEPLTRTGPREPWTDSDGRVAAPDLERRAGIRILANQDMTGAKLYLFDNAGVFLARLDLGRLLESRKTKIDPASRRGEFEILVAWNGTDGRGRRVGSGVYLARLFAWERTGRNQRLHQWIFHLGWDIPK